MIAVTDGGKRAVWGGRADVRKALYIATFSGIHFNPKIKAYYQGLRENGKNHKVAMTAFMRKLIVILNIMIREQSFWKHNV